MFGGRVLQQIVGIPMGSNCVPPLADVFLYLHEADIIHGLLKKNEKKLVRSFNFTFRYLDYALSLNNYRFCDFVDRIYPIKLEIKDTTDPDMSVSCSDIHLEMDSESAIKNETLHKRSFKFSHSELDIYKYKM